MVGFAIDPARQAMAASAVRTCAKEARAFPVAAIAVAG